MKKTIAVVEFPSGYKGYHFRNPIEDLEIGDKAVCDTVNGLTVGTVIDFRETSTQATRFIVQKIDLAAHQERVEKQKAIDALRKKMEQRRKEIQDVQVYALLAKDDPEMATMLSQLLSLEGKVSV